MIPLVLSRLRAFLLWGLGILLGAGALACTKPNRVDPADAAQVRSIDATVERLRQAYVNKDPPGFQALLMPLDSLQKLALEVERDFAIFERIQLDMGIDRVLIESTDVSVYFHWEGQWQRKTDDPPIRERGHAILRLVGHQDLALSGIEGDAPFGMASRQPTGEQPSRR
jgi:hypothetical protein